MYLKIKKCKESFLKWIFDNWIECNQNCELVLLKKECDEYKRVEILLAGFFRYIYISKTSKFAIFFEKHIKNLLKTLFAKHDELSKIAKN